MPTIGRPGTGETDAQRKRREKQEEAKQREVLAFKPEAVVGTFPPVPELIAEIEKLLAEARSGKLRAAAWAVVFHADGKPDGEVSSGWARGPYTAYGVTAAIERLSYRWKKHEWEPR